MSELTYCSICGCALEDEAECYEVVVARHAKSEKRKNAE